MKFLSDQFKTAEKNLIKAKEINEYYSKKIDEIINSIEQKESDLNKLRLEIDEKINHYGKLQNLEKWEAQLNLIKIEIEEKTNNLNQIYDNTFQTINWLTDKYADFYFLIDEKNIVYPRGNYAAKCSEAQKQFAKENRHLRKKNIELEIQLKKLESYYPNIDEIIDSDINESFFDDDSINTMDKIDSLVSKHEQEHLTKQEILQKALNTYLYSRKSKSCIGKDYERYIGYLYESKGYKVEYHGIKKGFEDLGIDLICTKSDETLLIQCKNWKKESSIRENAINQLFGTSIKFYLEKVAKNMSQLRGSLFENIGIPFNQNFKPIFVTTTKLSETAKDFASVLKIDVLEIPFDKNYPKIKCNIGKDEFGFETKIYHLPFDQMYDRVNNLSNGGLYVDTIEEAENLGFRRAFRWRG